MGMFDDVIIDTNKLPVSDKEKQIIGDNPGWQTKDFDCILTEIYITDNLMINRWDHETVPINERPDPEYPVIGSVRRINEHLEILVNYTGCVNFYTNINKDWYEFYAEFKNGKLIDITGGKDNYLDDFVNKKLEIK